MPSEHFADVPIGDAHAGGSDWAMLQKKRPSQLMQVRGNDQKGSLRRVLFNRERNRKVAEKDFPLLSEGSGSSIGSIRSNKSINDKGPEHTAGSSGAPCTTASSTANDKSGGVHVVLGLKDIGTIKKAKGYDPHNITKQHSFDVEDIQRRLSLEESDRPSSADIHGTNERAKRKKEMMQKRFLTDLERPSSAQKARRRRRPQSQKVSKRG